jgi:hypothetical protein
VQEKQVGDRPQSLERILVPVGDRLVGDVGAGHHQGRAAGLQEQVAAASTAASPRARGRRRD